MQVLQTLRNWVREHPDAVMAIASLAVTLVTLAMVPSLVFSKGHPGG